MIRIAVIVLLFAVLTAGCGFGANRETAHPATGEKRVGTSHAVVADKAKADEAETKLAGGSGEFRKFGAIEKIPDRVKANYYYVHAIPKPYLLSKGDWVYRADGYKNIMKYFDDDSAIFQSEKKFMEDCYAKGIKLCLVAYREFKPLEKGRILSHSLKFTASEIKVFVEYTYEYTFADGSRETKTERKVFTVREDRESVDFSNKITVVIVNIEDATEADG
jgi:hypothetical protein